MHARRVIVMGLAALVISSVAVFAQPRRGAGAGMPRYDKATETTVVGTVDEVQTHQGRAGGTGTHLVLKTETGSLDVHVGPTSWLADQKYAFAKGDRLEVIGSKVKVDSADAFLARTIKRGDSTIVLRNQDGIPAWSRGAMRAR